MPGDMLRSLWKRLTCRRPPVGDLQPAAFPNDLDWSSGKEEASLARLRDYAEGEASKASVWYLTKRTAKARQGTFLRGFSLLLAAAAGLVPVVSQLSWDAKAAPAVAPGWSPLFLGLAGLLVLFDRFLGGTSSWLRYMGAAQEIGDLLRRFRFDWTSQRAALGGATPNATEVSKLITSCATLVSEVDRVVRQETDAWANEFRNVLKQIDEAAAKVEKQRRQLGGIIIEVENGDQTDDGWRVRIDDGVESHRTGTTYSAAGLLPGVSKVSVSGTIGGVPKSAETTVNVPPADTVSVTLKLE